MDKKMKAHRRCPECDGRGSIPIIQECDSCQSLTYEYGYGCSNCGIGNPFVGINCLTIPSRPVNGL